MMLATLVVVVGIVAIVLIVASTRPNWYRIQRVTTIHAPPERIFALIADLRSWPRWSALEALDPAMKRSYTGVSSGRGAVYTWEGNRRAGKGRMEITETSPPSSATVEVTFARPFDAHNVNRFTLEPPATEGGGGTKVTWAMRGSRPYPLKVMTLFVPPDRLMGKHFETGLANLKAAAEQDAAAGIPG
jgi:uncharacterized protein YndB with AHSA1/START domain